MKVLLTRRWADEKVTLGTCEAGGRRWYSLELPWKDNAPSVSCIPPGSYSCVLTYSPRFKRPLYLVGGVPGRSGVRIHPANVARQLNGCVALGERLGMMEGEKAVLLSQPAVRSFMEWAGGRPFTLEIEYA